METSEKTYPYQLGLSITMYGRSFPVWVYDKVPEGMRRATSMRDFYNGRRFLFRSRLGSGGEYLTSIFRPSIRDAVERCLEDGAEIYVKEGDH